MLNFVKNKLSSSPSSTSSPELPSRPAKAEARQCRITVRGNKIILECDNGVRYELGSMDRAGGCVVVIDPETGTPRIECDRNIVNAIRRLRIF